MDMIDQLTSLSKKASQLKDQIFTEEAAKSSLVMPFIQILGYDVFNPLEVVPEYTADVGTKKGEKVDYAIMEDGNPIIIIECKSIGDNLDQGKCNQLYRYFSSTSARIGVLTDGILYKFFTDLDKPNLMDEKPYMTLNLMDLDDSLIKEVKKLAKDKFDIEKTIMSASDLKYTQEIKKLLQSEFENPSIELTKFIITKVYNGRATQNVLTWMSEILKKAMTKFIEEALNARLKSAMYYNSDETEIETANDQNNEEQDNNTIITTDEEREAFFIIKSMLRRDIPTDRIFIRDKKTYCGILLDDNNRKPICRLHFDRKQRHIGIFDSDNKEEKIPIETLDDLFQYEDQIRSKVSQYISS